MAVHKKHPADAKAMEGKEEKPKEEAVVSDIIAEAKERIKAAEEVALKKIESKAETLGGSESEVSPLTGFKEKMAEEEYPNSNMPAEKNFMWPILFIFIIAIALLVGIFVYKQGIFKEEKTSEAPLSPTPTIVEPQPTKTADLSQYEIKVLNGSEVGGEAGRQKTNLETEGFTVSAVGNADNSDYTDTVIQAKKEVDKGFTDRLKTVLEKSFVVGDMEELPEDENSDVIIILGSQTN